MSTGFTVPECELLVAMKLIVLTRGAADETALDDYRRHPFTMATTDWSQSLVSLQTKGLLVEEDEIYRLTAEGKLVAERVHADMMSRASGRAAQ